VSEHPRRHLLALALLLLCGVLLWTSERGRSPTADEPLHLVRGHVLWWRHDSRLSYAHPPLANAITSLPQASSGDEPWGLGAEPDGTARTVPERDSDPTLTRAEAITTLAGWKVAQPLDVSSNYFEHDYQRARAELTSARRMMMLWTLALALFMYVWVERRWGFVAGITTLSLFALHPTLIAHGQLATTDMPLAATVFVSLAALIGWIERPTWGRAALFGLATTAMVLSKHSGLAYVVVMSLMLLAVAALRRGGFAELPGSRARTVGITLAQLAAVAVVMIFLIDAAYLFDRVGMRVDELLAEPEPHNWISRKRDFDLLDKSPIAKLPEGLRLPFPFTWLVGLATVSEQNAMGHGHYFFGPRASGGHPLYFPVMLFAKSPTGLLVLLAVALAMFVARVRAAWRPSLAGVVLLVFAGLSLASACASEINIGVRHVLPLLPIMLVFAGRGAAWLLAEPIGLPRWLTVGRRPLGLWLGCLLGCAIGAAATFPAYLGDFNLLVGGPRGGHRISVVGEDWGQDLGDLAEYAKQRGWDSIAYHSSFPLRREELESHGLTVHEFGCKTPYHGSAPVVVHLGDWERRRSCFEWLRERRPAHVINHHMLVFE
jgi:hypothetical protein